LSLGTGVIVSDIPLPIFVPDASAYQIRESIALILSHECDISQDNKRPNNSDVIVVPLIPFEEFFATLPNDAAARSYVGHLVSGNISQLFFLPPWEKHPTGSVVYLNRICSTHIDLVARDGVKKVIALSAYGHQKLIERLGDHLLRGKAEQLPPPA
jgi:hypothetical protein